MTESLTTSRVNRLLRPLRNTCNSLAGLPKAAAASKQSSNWDPGSRPPLTLLCPLAGSKKLTISKHSVDDFELSRRIYAVCDAFKNIAHAAFREPCSDHIPSLAAMCSLVIGSNLSAVSSDKISGDDVSDESDELDVDDIYELVPPHYRRFLIMSHALSIILYICPHHHTLVTVLLDHCLSSGLVYESTRLLNIVLAQAFLPSGSSPPLVTHPDHENYLVDLHAKWTSRNNPSGTSSSFSLFTTYAFCQAVLNTLSQSSPTNAYILWTSKVLRGLFHTVENCVDSYTLIVHGLSCSFRRSSGFLADTVQDGAPPVILGNKLSESLSILFNLLFVDRGTLPSTPTLSRIYAAIDILVNCQAGAIESSTDLADMVITFAAHLFVTYRNSIRNSDQILAILDDTSPAPSAFSKLMVYFGRLKEGQTFEAFMEMFISELRKYSSVFRFEKLLGLDASLWACALQYFQISAASSQKSGSILVTRYKQQFIEAVDTAERRCFGRDLDTSPVVTVPLRIQPSRVQRGRPSGHWEWEDMVESWIRKTPVQKKRKIDIVHPRPGDATTSKIASISTSTLTPLSICHRHASTSSPLSSYTQLSEPRSPTEEGSEYHDETDKENYPSDPPPIVERSHAIRRRNTNFFSILADAQTNRIILHSNPHPEPKLSSSVIPEKYVLPGPSRSRESVRPPHKQQQKPSRGKVAAPPATLLLSDDLLDLFACATSSPVKY